MTSLRTIFSTVLFVANSYATILSTYDISKCCKFNETLNSRQECESTNRTGWESAYAHIVEGIPVEGFGGWTLIENKVPNCERLVSLPVEPLLVVIEGNLYVSALDKMIADSDYCVDMDYIMLCDTFLGNKTLVNRCCGTNAIYSNETRSCKRVNKDNSIDLGGNVFFKVTLPCNQIVSVGIVSNETRLYENGSFEVMNELYPHESFCLEYMGEEGKQFCISKKI